MKWTKANIGDGDDDEDRDVDDNDNCHGNYVVDDYVDVNDDDDRDDNSNGVDNDDSVPQQRLTRKKYRPKVAYLRLTQTSENVDSRLRD